MTSHRQEKHLFDGDGFGEYVIISRGPGAEVLLEYEVLFVEPENVQPLRKPSANRGTMTFAENKD